MVPGLAFFATAVATVFAMATLKRFTSRHAPHERAWTIALALFAFASAALALGSSGGWDSGTFRAFYLLGAIVNVPWLALGTVYLLFGPAIGRRCEIGLIFFSGLAFGVMTSTPIMGRIPIDRIPEGKDLFNAFPRALAGVGSGVGATVIFVGAIYSAVRFFRRRATPGAARLAVSNTLIAVGTLVLSSGGIIQGALGHDEAFVVTLAVGIAVVYAGFVVAGSIRRTVVEPTVAPSLVAQHAP
jgi:hypothetical protein